MVKVIYNILVIIGAISIMKLIFSHKKEKPKTDPFSTKDVVSFLKFLIETETVSEMGKINLVGGVFLIIAIVAYFVYGSTIVLIPNSYSEPAFKYVLSIPITFIVCMAFTSVINHITQKYE